MSRVSAILLENASRRQKPHVISLQEENVPEEPQEIRRSRYERERPTRRTSSSSLCTRPQESGHVGGDQRRLSTSPCNGSLRRKGDELGDLAHPRGRTAYSR